jgi:hypothetical protein
MNHQPLTDLLEATARAAGAASFWHGKQTSANLNYDAPFPQAHLFLMPSQLKGGYITTQCAMCFYGKDEHENPSNLADPQALAIQNEMDLLTQRFYQLVRELPGVELLGDEMQRVPTLRNGAGIGTGYFVNFTLTHTAQC